MFETKRLVLAAVSALFLACGGGGDPSGAPTPGTAAKLTETTTARAGQPKPYVPVEAAPLTGTERLDLSIEVTDRTGTTVPLSSLLEGPSVVFFTSDDRRSQANLATSRLLRDLVKGGAAVGFRTLVLFDEDTSVRGLEKWFRKRRVARAPARVAVEPHRTNNCASSP